jgi:hypothetical protein
LLDALKEIGSYAGLAAFFGLAVLALLSFAHGRDIRRLRDWAGSAPERDAERKESTSAIAAQRAEELRELEEARTAEHEAIEHREVRRQRREEGLPELTRGERISERFSGLGQTLSRPLALVAVFVVVVLIAAGVFYAVTNSGDSTKGDSGSGSTQAAAKVKPNEIKVAVLNGTATPNLAADIGTKAEKKEFDVVTVGNTPSSYEGSLVMFVSGHKPEAKMVSKQLGIAKLEPMNGEVKAVSEGANVAVVVGEDNAAAAG